MAPRKTKKQQRQISDDEQEYTAPYTTEYSAPAGTSSYGSPAPATKTNLSFRVTDIIPRFDGSTDVVLWLEKVDLACEVQSISNVAALIPLFLEGAAFDVYQQMDSTDKTKKNSISAKLREAFGLTPAHAFALFKKRALQIGESPDAYMADIYRLLTLVGCMPESDDTERLACSQFIDGLPEPSRAQVKALTDNLTRQRILTVAKSVLADSPHRGPQLGLAGLSSPPPGPARCRGCNRQGHVQKDCRVECYGCKKRGHIQSRCLEQKPEN